MASLATVWAAHSLQSLMDALFTLFARLVSVTQMTEGYERTLHITKLVDGWSATVSKAEATFTTQAEPPELAKMAPKNISDKWIQHVSNVMHFVQLCKSLPAVLFSEIPSVGLQCSLGVADMSQVMQKFSETRSAEDLQKLLSFGGRPLKFGSNLQVWVQLCSHVMVASQRFFHNQVQSLSVRPDFKMIAALVAAFVGISQSDALHRHVTTSRFTNKEQRKKYVDLVDG